MNESDLELIRRFHDGNQQVFDEIYARYAKRVYAWHRRRCRDHAKADDLAQLTMIKLYKKLLKGHELEQESLEPLLMDMSQDVERDEKKRAKEPCEPLPEEIVDPTAEPRSNDIADRLQAIAATMSPKVHETVVMALLGGLTAEEIAAKTQATLSAVKKRIRRGRSAVAATLRAQWKGTHHDLDGRSASGRRAGESAAGAAGRLSR